MSGGDFEVIGATLPGTPAVALGRNRFIAWGATNVAADVEDLYRERLDASGTHAEFRGAQEPLTIIPETIVVKGGDAGRGRRAHHPPRPARLRRDQRQQRGVDDASRSRAPLEPLAFRWTALDADDTTVAAFLQAERGAQLERVHRGAARVRRRRRRISSTPTSTATSATTRPAASRCARAATDRGRPKAGPATPSGPAGFRSTSCRTSTTRRSTSSSPPTTGRRRPAIRICSASSGPSRIARSGSPTCCAATTKLTPDDFARDPGRHHVAARARRCCRCCSRTRTRDGGPHQQAVDAAAAVELRRRRRQRRRGDLPAPGSIELAPALAGDDLGPLLTDDYAERFSFVTRFVVHTLTANDSAWCDDRTTGERETCDDAVTAALHEGGRRSDRQARQRHVALAVGRRAPRRVSASGARRRRARCVRSSAARCRTAATGAPSTSAPVGGRPSVRAARGARLPRRSSISRPPTTAASSTPSGSRDISCRRTTTISWPTGAPSGTGRCGWSASDIEARRDRAVAADAVTCSAGLSGPAIRRPVKGPPCSLNGCIRTSPAP